MSMALPPPVREPVISGPNAAERKAEALSYAALACCLSACNALFVWNILHFTSLLG